LKHRCAYLNGFLNHSEYLYSVHNWDAPLEQSLIAQLQSLKYARVKIKDQASMLANFKQQLEIHNSNITLSKTEF
jgi:hypothetical protein